MASCAGSAPCRQGASRTRSRPGRRCCWQLCPAPWCASTETEQAPRPVEIGGRVDAERDGIDQHRADAHAVLDGAELLEALAQFEAGRLERDEFLERGA